MLNTILYWNSQPYIDEGIKLHPTYAHAADGHRYWGVAANLAKGLGFVYDDTNIYDKNKFSPPNLASLVRGGPVTPLVFSIPIRLFGLDGAVPFIVSFQCALLYVIGLLSRRLARPFGINKTIVQGLCIFNPTLLVSAHHAQSEIIFCICLTLLLVCIFWILDKKLNLFSFIILGVLLGLLALIRAPGWYFLFAIPVIFLAINLSKILQGHYVRVWTTSFYMFISIFVALSVLSPWLVHQHKSFGGISPYPTSHTSLRDNYVTLMSYAVDSDPVVHSFYVYGYGGYSDLRYRDLKSEQLNNLQKTVQNNSRLLDPDADCLISFTELENSIEVTSPRNVEPFHPLGMRNPSRHCDQIITRALISSIMQQPLNVQLKAISQSLVGTFLSGGGTGLTNYLAIDSGLKDKDIFTLFGKFYIDHKSYQRFISEFLELNISYIVVYLLPFGFAVMGRLLGIFGLLTSIRARKLLPHNILFLSTIFIFSITYLFMGVSRFRVPLEPILMIYMTIGIHLVLHLVTKLYRLR